MKLDHFRIVPKYWEVSAWWQHVPIAHWLIGTYHPRKVVELGTHNGVSLFAFCDAAAQVSPETFVYGIDTWEGDAHAGFYDETVYSTVQEYWNVHHRSRSSLIRSTFDEAATYFSLKSVDLLHLDGLHTYEAVSHDFDTWRPLMAEDGMMLLHDINVKTGGFGVWRFWNDLKRRHPDQCIEIRNGHGLGILFLDKSTMPKEADWKQMFPALLAKGLILEDLAKKSQMTRELNLELANLNKQGNKPLCARCWYKIRTVFQWRSS